MYVCVLCRCVAIGNSYNDEERCVLAGYDNGDVKLFDLRMNRVSAQTHMAVKAHAQLGSAGKQLALNQATRSQGIRAAQAKDLCTRGR